MGDLVVKRTLAATAGLIALTVVAYGQQAPWTQKDVETIAPPAAEPAPEPKPVIKKDVCIGLPGQYGHSAPKTYMWMFVDWAGSYAADCDFDTRTKAGRAVKRECGKLFDAGDKALDEPQPLCRVEGLFRVTNERVRMSLIRVDRVQVLPPPAKMPTADWLEVAKD
jgi:hypothetical protein